MFKELQAAEQTDDTSGRWLTVSLQSRHHGEPRSRFQAALTMPADTIQRSAHRRWTVKLCFNSAASWQVIPSVKFNKLIARPDAKRNLAVAGVNNAFILFCKVSSGIRAMPLLLQAHANNWLNVPLIYGPTKWTKCDSSG